MYLVYTRGDEVGTVDTYDALKTFLAPIDNLHDAALVWRTVVVAAARRRVGLVAPLVRLVLEPPGVPRLPAPGDPLEAVGQPVDEEIHGLAGGGGLDLHAHRSAVEVDVDLRDDRPLPRRVAVAGHPDAGVQHGSAGVGQDARDLPARVVHEVVRHTAPQLDDRVGPGGSLLCPAHAATLLLKIRAATGADRTPGRGRRAQAVDRPHAPG